MRNKKALYKKYSVIFIRLIYIYYFPLIVCEILHAMTSLNQSVREKRNHHQNTFFKIIPEGLNRDGHLKYLQEIQADIKTFKKVCLRLLEQNIICTTTHCPKKQDCG